MSSGWAHEPKLLDHSDIVLIDLELAVKHLIYEEDIGALKSQLLSRRVGITCFSLAELLKMGYRAIHSSNTIDPMLSYEAFKELATESTLHISFTKDDWQTYGVMGGRAAQLGNHAEPEIIWTALASKKYGFPLATLSPHRYEHLWHDFLN